MIYILDPAESVQVGLLLKKCNVFINFFDTDNDTDELYYIPCKHIQVIGWVSHRSYGIKRTEITFDKDVYRWRQFIIL